MKRLIALTLTGLAAGFLFYLACLNHLEPNETGIKWNYFTGQVELQPPGWHVTPPWVAVSRVDTRPQRVCVTSASRAVNCRLVSFEPVGYQSFVETEGFRYYWWANRISFNSGYEAEYRGMRDLLRGYAYSVVEYPFIKVHREYRPDE